MNSLEINSVFSTHRNLVSIPTPVDQAIPGIQEWGGIRKSGYGKIDRDDLPLVSVITVVKNNAGSIGEAIESVIRQTYANIELLVIDGGSDDGTIDIIKLYDDTIDLWISGKDSGIYDAMNRGLSLAQGRYVHFLNSDDHYSFQRAVELIVEQFKSTHARWIHANILMLDKQKGKGWIRYSNVSRYYYLFKGIPQQAFFFEKKLFDEFGAFNLEYRIVADLDFLLHIMLKQDIPGKYLNMPVVIFDTRGVSGNMERKKSERESVLRKYFPRWAFRLIRNRFFAWLLITNETPDRKKSLLEKLMSSTQNVWR
jgi:glycosyltransferase involved in cell wall biosynthesis